LVEEEEKEEGENLLDFVSSITPEMKISMNQATLDRQFKAIQKLNSFAAYKQYLQFYENQMTEHLVPTWKAPSIDPVPIAILTKIPPGQLRAVANIMASQFLDAVREAKEKADNNDRTILDRPARISLERYYIATNMLLSAAHQLQAP